jgi:hypothetical protein
VHKEKRFTGKWYVVHIYIYKFLYLLYWRSICTNISLVHPDLKDKERNDTTKTYKEWLRVQGELDAISKSTSVTTYLVILFLHKHIISYTSDHYFMQWPMWTVPIKQMKIATPHHKWTDHLMLVVSSFHTESQIVSNWMILVCCAVHLIKNYVCIF